MKWEWSKIWMRLFCGYQLLLYVLLTQFGKSIQNMFMKLPSPQNIKRNQEKGIFSSLLLFYIIFWNIWILYRRRVPTCQIVNNKGTNITAGVCDDICIMRDEVNLNNLVKKNLSWFVNWLLWLWRLIILLDYPKNCCRYGYFSCWNNCCSKCS